MYTFICMFKFNIFKFKYMIKKNKITCMVVQFSSVKYIHCCKTRYPELFHLAELKVYIH